MAIRESETRATSDAGSPAFRKFAEGYLGLKPEHLLPGLDVAANLLQRGDYEKALRIYSVLVLYDPADARFQRGLAECALAAGNFQLAYAAGVSLIVGNPADPEGYLFTGRAAFGLREFDAAIDDFREATRLADAAGDTAAAQGVAPLLQRALIAKDARAET